MDSSVFEFGNVHCCNSGFQLKISNKMANSVDPDGTAHLELHSLQRYMFCLRV